jgi:hypothetical protein
MMNSQQPAPQWANPEANRPNAANAVPSQEEEFFAPLSTLDEPVMETIMRDVRAVASKLKVVMLPMDRTVSRTVLTVYGVVVDEVLVVCMLTCCPVI